MGLQLESRTVADPSQLPAAVEQMRPRIDVLYSANDNTVNKGALSVASTAQALKLPFIIGELSAVSKGAVAGVGVEYTQMGQHLGELAATILARGSKEALPPREPAPPAKFWINLPVASEIGLSISPEALAKADKVIK